MIEAGLVRAPNNERADGDRGARDFFFGRLMFPIADVRGRIVAFGGRALTDDASRNTSTPAKPRSFPRATCSTISKRARGRAQGRAARRRRRLHGRDRAGRSGVHRVRGALGHRAHRRPARAPVEKRARTHPLFRRRRSGRAGGGARGAACACRISCPGNRCGSRSCRQATIPIPFSARRAPRPCAACSTTRSRLPTCCGGRNRGQGFLHPRTARRAGGALSEIVRAIRDGKIADYYKRDFDDRVFKAFKSRARPAGAKPRVKLAFDQPPGRAPGRRDFPPARAGAGFFGGAERPPCRQFAAARRGA